MKELVIDVERLKYPHSGVGFYCSCLKRGLEALPQTLLEPPGYRTAFYGVKLEGESKGYRHRPWHRFINPSICHTPWALHITHQLQTYFPYIPKATKCIVTLHDLNFLYEQLSRRQRSRRLNTVRRNLERADIIVCISEFVRCSLLEHRVLFSLKPSVRIEVIHNGIAFPDYPEREPETLKFDKESYLLSIGVLQEKKQQHLLVELLPHLPSDINLVLVYSSRHYDYHQKLLETIERLNLRSRVVLLSSVSAEEKLYLLRHCLAYTHPSLAEGFGIPPIEAMHEGRPVFLSKMTSLPEIGGNEAYYFDSSEPEAMASTILTGLASYTESPNKLDTLKAWVSQYDYRTMARHYHELYLSLL